MADEALPEVTPADEAAMRGDESAPAAPEPAVAPSAAPAVAPESAGAEPKAEEPKDEPEKKRDVVPLATLLEERKEAKEREKRMEERFQQLVTRFAPKPPEQPAKPSVDEQPLEVVRQHQQFIENFQQQQTQQTQEQQFLRAYALQAHQFTQQQPDFTAAYEHWKNSIAEEMADAMGYSDPFQIGREIETFERNMALKAFQDGVNPAERLYKASQRRGYRKAGEAPKQEAPDVGKQVETLARGAEASRSLGTAGGSPAEAGLTLKALADMTNEDFAKISDKDFERAMTRG